MAFGIDANLLRQFYFGGPRNDYILPAFEAFDAPNGKGYTFQGAERVTDEDKAKEIFDTIAQIGKDIDARFGDKARDLYFRLMDYYLATNNLYRIDTSDLPYLKPKGVFKSHEATLPSEETLTLSLSLLLLAQYDTPKASLSPEGLLFKISPQQHAQHAIAILPQFTEKGICVHDDGKTLDISFQLAPYPTLDEIKKRVSEAEKEEIERICQLSIKMGLLIINDEKELRKALRDLALGWARFIGVDLSAL